LTMKNDLHAAIGTLERRKHYLSECMKESNNPWAETNQTEIDALAVAISALRDVLQRQPDPITGLVPCGGKMRIDTPPGNDSVRASTGFQRDGGDKTESRCNQCIHCGQEMPEGDQVCGLCRGDE